MFDPVSGAVAANAMFSLAAISISDHHRASPAHLLAEVIATLGLLLVMFAVPAFVVAQLAGGAVAYAVIRALYPDVTPAEAADVVVPHELASVRQSIPSTPASRR